MEKRTLGQLLSDQITQVIGSWRFLISQNSLIAIWCVLNLVAWFYHWDPYPFILLNLCMSWQAANATPIIMMSQNRQAERDRKQIDRIEELAGRTVAIEQMLDQHIRDQSQQLQRIEDKLTSL